jgi:HAD superfamily hydrolase (TIGR01509 family)
MDGTLVDTEPFWMTAQDELVSSYGGVWTEETAMTLVGSGLWRTARIMQEHGVDLEEGVIIDRLSHRVMEQISEGVPWRPGAKELLSALKERGIPTALVTMSIDAMAQHVRSYVPFDGFDIVVSGDHVTNSKPHPEAYLLAASQLGVDIEQCVAIEDSIPGVTSAAASGAVTIGVPHYLTLEGSPATTLWSTLDGRTPDDVFAVFRAARSTTTTTTTTNSSTS